MVTMAPPELEMALREVQERLAEADAEAGALRESMARMGHRLAEVKDHRARLLEAWALVAYGSQEALDDLRSLLVEPVDAEVEEVDANSDEAEQPRVVTVTLMRRPIILGPVY